VNAGTAEKFSAEAKPAGAKPVVDLDKKEFGRPDIAGDALQGVFDDGNKFGSVVGCGLIVIPCLGFDSFTHRIGTKTVYAQGLKPEQFR